MAVFVEMAAAYTTSMGYINTQDFKKWVHVVNSLLAQFYS